MTMWYPVLGMKRVIIILLLLCFVGSQARAQDQDVDVSNHDQNKEKFLALLPAFDPNGFDMIDLSYSIIIGGGGVASLVSHLLLRSMQRYTDKLYFSNFQILLLNDPKSFGEILLHTRYSSFIEKGPVQNLSNFYTEQAESLAQKLEKLGLQFDVVKMKVDGHDVVTVISLFNYPEGYYGRTLGMMTPVFKKISFMGTDDVADVKKAFSTSYDALVKQLRLKHLGLQVKLNSASGSTTTGYQKNFDEVSKGLMSDANKVYDKHYPPTFEKAISNTNVGYKPSFFSVRGINQSMLLSPTKTNFATDIKKAGRGMFFAGILVYGMYKVFYEQSFINEDSDEEPKHEDIVSYATKMEHLLDALENDDIPSAWVILDDFPMLAQEATHVVNAVELYQAAMEEFESRP